MKGYESLIYLAGFIISLCLTVVIERLMLPKLRAIAKQPIYTDGPKWHESKSGTPTMGGVAFAIGIDVALILFSLLLINRGERMRGLLLIATLAYATLNGAVGVIDDIKKLKRRQNAGLSPTQKLLLQTLIAAAYMLAVSAIGLRPQVFEFTFGDIDFGIFYYPIALLILLGITNCANLSDGVDGLASCTSFGIGAVLLLLSFAVYPDVAFTGAVLMGGMCGFLIFNLNPARVFMGDTGSLFLGAMLAAASFSLGNPTAAIVIGGIYVIEGVSVILQVIIFKITGRRLFKMAPIHHHLEKCGWSENRICIAALLFTLAMAIPALLLFGGMV